MKPLSVEMAYLLGIQNEIQALWEILQMPRNAIRSVVVLINVAVKYHNVLRIDFKINVFSHFNNLFMCCTKITIVFCG